MAILRAMAQLPDITDERDQSQASVQLLDQWGQHAFHLDGALGQSLMILRLDQLQVSRQQQLLLQFYSADHRSARCIMH